MTQVDAILARLLALHPKRIDLSLDRMWRILDALDHPERRLPPVIHVAGTNGKGSTVAFMRAMLEAAGHSVHVYTSPNLVRMNERFRLGAIGGGVLVSDSELVEVLAECERKNADAPITVFEIETAAAFVLFSRHPADVLLLEVGLGGRLDATNVVERPLVDVITPISIDHIDFLGDTLEKIATEKASIFKPDVPAVIAAQSEGALAVIKRKGAEVGAPLHVFGEEWVAGEERGGLVYQDHDGLLDLPAPRLFGRHQFANAGTAIAALRVANMKLSARALEQGIVKAEWPARMQRLTTGAGLARRLIAVPIHQDKGMPADALAGIARHIGLPADSCESVEAALGMIGDLALSPAPRILITGSLYLAGEVLSANGTPPN